MAAPPLLLSFPLVFLIWYPCFYPHPSLVSGYTRDPRMVRLLKGGMPQRGFNRTVNVFPAGRRGNGSDNGVDKRHIDSYPDPFEGVYVDELDDFLTPEIRIRVTKTGIDVAHQIFEKVVDAKIQAFMRSYRMPDYVQNLTDGQVCQTTNNRVVQFHLPTFAYALNPGGNTIIWTTHGGFMNVTGDWSVASEADDGKDAVVHNGHYSIMLKDVFLIMDIRPVLAADGTPLVESVDCNATIHNSAISFTGGSFVFRMMLNAIGQLMMTQLKELLADQFCNRASELMEFRINRRLGLFPTSVPVLSDHPVRMDTRPVSEAVIGQEFIDGYLEGCFYWANQTCAHYYQTFPEPPPSLAGRMLVVQFTEAVFHSFMHVLFEQDLMGIGLNERLFPEYAEMLRTECDGLCIGSASAMLGERWPNRSVALQLNGLHPIYLRINPPEGGIRWSAEAELVAEVEGLEGDDGDYLEGVDQGGDFMEQGRFMSAIVFLNGTLENLRVADARFHADMLVDAFDLTNIKSAFDDFPPAKVDQIARMVFHSERTTIERELSAWLEHGIPIPLMPSLKIKSEPEVVIQEGAVAFGIDVEYDWGQSTMETTM